MRNNWQRNSTRNSTISQETTTTRETMINPRPSKSTKRNWKLMISPNKPGGVLLPRFVFISLQTVFFFLIFYPRFFRKRLLKLANIRKLVLRCEGRIIRLGKKSTLMGNGSFILLLRVRASWLFLKPKLKSRGSSRKNFSNFKLRPIIFLTRLDIRSCKCVAY